MLKLRVHLHARSSTYALGGTLGIYRTHVPHAQRPHLRIGHRVLCEAPDRHDQFIGVVLSAAHEPCAEGLCEVYVREA